MTRRYQGAYTKMFNRCVRWSVPADDVWIYHDDVKSMYPSSMVVLNLSPESVHFVSKKPYTGEYRFDYAGGIIEVPDKYCGQVTVSVDFEDSVTRKFMLEMRAMRDKLREGVQNMETRSSQTAVKLIMNTLYGYSGLEFSRYGSFLVAIVTTAVGRLIMDIILDIVKANKYMNLECDTDGNYHYGRDVSQQINDAVGQRFADYPLHNKLRVETHRYKAMLTYRAKNYLLLTRDNNMKVKGSAFHGRHMPPICRTALHTFGRAIFDKKPWQKVWTDFHDLRKFGIREFTMSVSLNKDPSAAVGEEDAYDEGTMLHQLSQKLGDDAVWGQDVYYVKTVDGFTPIGYKTDKELLRLLDRKYYMQRIKTVVDRLKKSVYGMHMVKLRPNSRYRSRKVLSDGNRLEEFW